MCKPEKMVMVGDKLTGNILFGKVNKMATVWLTEFRIVSQFLSIWCEDLHKLEKISGNRIFTEKATLDHGELKINL